MNTENNINCN